MLKLEHISKTYPGVKALNDLNISFEQGEIHAILGENGAGKSTMIKIITGAIQPDRTTVRSLSSISRSSRMKAERSFLMMTPMNP